MSGTRATSQAVRYRERLRVPWWWWPPAVGLAVLVALEVNQAARGLPDWIAFAALFAVAAAVLVWLGRVEVRVVGDEPLGRRADGSDEPLGRRADGTEAKDVELWAGHAHVPADVITRSAEIPRSAKFAALGRQLDPAAFVLHRAWIGPMVLVVLGDPDDPTPYWLVSTRHPDRVLRALQS